MTQQTNTWQPHRQDVALIITICSTKGGVGKTTVTANLGGLLSDLGQRVLLVDGDVQPTLSSYFELAECAPQGLVDVFTSGETTDAVSRTTIGCDIVVSNDPEGKLADWVLHTPDGRFRLKRILKRLDYDVILIDTQGAVGPLQDAAVLAADFLVSPIPPEQLSASEFTRGTIAMLERLSDMEAMGFPLGNLYGLIYRMDRTVDAREIAEVLRRSSYGPSHGRIRILDTVVPATVAYREAASAHLPVHRWESTRTGPTPSGLETMLNLVRELPLGLEDVAMPSTGSAAG